jgi:hypothetical protein
VQKRFGSAQLGQHLRAPGLLGREKLQSGAQSGGGGTTTRVDVGGTQHVLDATARVA